MKAKVGSLLIPAMIFGLTLSMPAFAQEGPSDQQPASESMQQAGQQAEGAAKDAYQGAATAISDSSITAKVKIALHDDKDISNDNVHVSTTAGVVTLRGTVGSLMSASHAEQLARATSGVRNVRNMLQVSSRTSSN